MKGWVTGSFGGGWGKRGPEVVGDGMTKDPDSNCRWTVFLLPLLSSSFFILWGRSTSLWSAPEDVTIIVTE